MKEVLLHEVCTPDGIQTGPFGSQLHQSDYSPSGVPVIMPVNLVEGRVSENGIARVSEDHVQRLAKYKVSVGDIVYSRRGDVGRCSRVGSAEAGWLCGTGCLRITPDPSKIDPNYLFYMLSLPSVIGWVRNNAKGTTMPNLNTEILSAVPLRIESDLLVQKRIAEVLVSYDALIENNRKQIKLLEEAAQRLYKEWFIDLRFPGHEDTEIDPETGLPEGWKRKRLGELADYISRGVAPKYADESDWHVLGQTCIRDNLVLLENSRKLAPINDLNKVIRFGDVLINSTGVGSLGRTAQVWFNPENITVDSHVTIVRGTSSLYSFYLGLWAFSNEQLIESLHTGSTGQTELPKDRLASIRLLKPPSNILLRLNAIVKPLITEILAKQNLIASLSEARNRLLPRLMEGEIEL